MLEFIICHSDISGTKIRHLVLLVLKDNKFSLLLPSLLRICRYMKIKWTQWIINRFKYEQEQLDICQIIVSLIALRLYIIFTQIRSYDIIRIWLLMCIMMTYLSIMECDSVKNTIKEALSHTYHLLSVWLIQKLKLSDYERNHYHDDICKTG